MKGKLYFKPETYHYLTKEFFYSLLLFIFFCAISITTVLVVSIRERNDKQEVVRNGLLVDITSGISEYARDLSSGAHALASALKGIDCADLPKAFPLVSKDILTWAQISNLHFDPSGYVSDYVYPHTERTFQYLPRGYEFLVYNRGMVLNGVFPYKETYFGPFDSENLNVVGSYVMIMFVPIWLPAASVETPLGCGIEPSDCSGGVCYNETSKEKFYGFVRSTFIANAIVDGSHPIIYDAENQGYEVTIKSVVGVPDFIQPNWRFLYPTDIHGSDNDHSDTPVTSEFITSNLHWRVSVSPDDGWEPLWRTPALVVAIVLSGICSVLVYLLLIERTKNRQILQAMLPEKVIKYLSKTKSKPYAEQFDSVTILFCDIVDFTPLAASLQPMQIVEVLDALYGKYDQLTAKHNVYKVETIGDAFMAVAGCPNKCNPVLSAYKIVALAQDIIATAEAFQHPHLGDRKIRTRVGIHSGSVVAGVAGTKMPRYCLYGDVVNTASRMESSSLPMHIHISDGTADLLKQQAESCKVNGRFLSNKHLMKQPLGNEYIRNHLNIISRGKIQVKGKGEMETFWVSTEDTIEVTCRGVEFHPDEQMLEVTESLDDVDLSSREKPFPATITTSSTESTNSVIPYAGEEIAESFKLTSMV